MCKQELALNYQQGLTCQKTQTTNKEGIKLKRLWDKISKDWHAVKLNQPILTVDK